VIAAHDSLLPRLRGFAPTNWALILGHDRVGVTLFRISEGIDEGEVFFQASHPVAEHDTFSKIVNKQAELSVELFEQYLDAARQGKLQPAPQDHYLATYTCSRGPEDGEIDWSAPTMNIQRLIRALGPPAPYAFTFYDGKRLTIVRAHAVRNPADYEGRIPGRIIARDAAEGTVDVLTGDGVLRIETVSYDGQQPVSASHLITSVRKSLGLHVASEVGRLETQIQQLEQRILHLEGANAKAQSAA
jgi:methionyl-tRNA formyltransferase